MFGKSFKAMFKQQSELKIEGLVFDMDGVLVDTTPSHSKAYDQLWQSLSIDGPEYSEIAGRSTKEVVAEFASHLNEKQLHDAVAFKQTSALELLKTAEISYVDTLSALRDLQARSLPMVVATSASCTSAELALKSANIAHFFSAVITAADVERAKPAPDLFQAGISALGCTAEQALIFEDSQSGLQAAIAAGAYVVAVRDVPELDKNIVDSEKFMGHFDSLNAVVEALV